jgi:hypothetical protein
VQDGKYPATVDGRSTKVLQNSGPPQRYESNCEADRDEILPQRLFFAVAATSSHRNPGGSEIRFDPTNHLEEKGDNDESFPGCIACLQYRRGGKLRYGW